MKTNLEDLSTFQKKISIEIPAEKVNATFDKYLKNKQKTSTLKGFRPGKVPLQTIRNLYYEHIKSDVLQNLLENAFYNAMDEYKLQAIGQPKFDFNSIEENNPFNVSITVEVKPPINLQQIEGLNIKKENLNISDEKINQTLNEIQRQYATYEPIEENRSSQQGDVVNIDLYFLNEPSNKNNEKNEDNKDTENKSSEIQAQEFNIELGERGNLEDLDKNLVNMKIGDEKTFGLTFPENFPNPQLQGKTEAIKVKLKKIQKKILPPLNDELVSLMKKDNTPFDSFQELKDYLLGALKNSENKRIEQDINEQILDMLIEKNPIEIPPSLIEEQKNSMMENAKQQLKYNQHHQYSEEEINQYQENNKEEIEQEAKKVIHAFLLIEHIANQYGISCTPQELNNYVNAALNKNPNNEETKKYYQKTSTKKNIAYQITERKVLQFLKEKANFVPNDSINA